VCVLAYPRDPVNLLVGDTFAQGPHKQLLLPSVVRNEETVLEDLDTGQVFHQHKVRHQQAAGNAFDCTEDEGHKKSHDPDAALKPIA